MPVQSTARQAVGGFGAGVSTVQPASTSPTPAESETPLQPEEARPARRRISGSSHLARPLAPGACLLGDGAAQEVIHRPRDRPHAQARRIAGHRPQRARAPFNRRFPAWAGRLTSSSSVHTPRRAERYLLTCRNNSGIGGIIAHPSAANGRGTSNYDRKGARLWPNLSNQPSTDPRPALC